MEKNTEYNKHTDRYNCCGDVINTFSILPQIIYMQFCFASQCLVLNLHVTHKYIKMLLLKYLLCKNKKENDLTKERAEKRNSSELMDSARCHSNPRAFFPEFIDSRSDQAFSRKIRVEIIVYKLWLKQPLGHCVCVQNRS
jgi:hypothetical protein